MMPIGRRVMAGVGASLLISSGPASAATDGRQNVTAALEASAAAWSRGDLDGFMQVYERAPETTYLKAAGPVRGYDAIRAMYAPRFTGKPGATGQLSLQVLDYRALGSAFALVTGRFALQPRPPATTPAQGIFTLVFHRTPAGWRIVSDHTSE